MKINSTSIAVMSSESTFLCPYNSPGTIYNMYVMYNHFTCSAFHAIQDACQVANGTSVKSNCSASSVKEGV